MNRTRALSGLIGLSLLIGFACGQPPAADKKDAPPKKEPSAKSPLEDAIAKALKNNPDVRVAEAEVQLAQAKLAQSKLAVAQKVTAAHLAVERAKADTKVAEANFERTVAMRKKGFIASEEAEAAQQKLDAAKAAVAKAEADYNVALGVLPNQNVVAWELAGFTTAFTAVDGTIYSLAADGNIRANLAANAIDLGTTRLMLDSIYSTIPPTPAPGSVADKLKAALDKPVKLPAQNNVNLNELLGSLTKAAGLDVRVRVPPAEDPKITRDPIRLSVEAGEFSLGTWFQLVTDEYAQTAPLHRIAPNDPFQRPARYEVYVREYGLLVADPKNAPPGAWSVNEFWKQVKAEKEKAEPKK
jgi:hypothetical protein